MTASLINTSNELKKKHWQLNVVGATSPRGLSEMSMGFVPEASSVFVTVCQQGI